MRNTSELADSQFDVTIIGGGISGAWLALHCAQQGYKTALIERSDYASATSSSSSKLLHGGIRYLQQFEFDKVRESAMERAEYVYAAPHLSTPVPFLIPTYPDFKRSKFFLNCGMVAYRMLCLGENKLIESPEQKLPGIRSINASALNKICDLEQEKHTGAVVFYERHMLDSERMVLAVIQSARQLGALTYNYVNAEGFLGDEHKITGVRARDVISQKHINIHSKLVINAAGPFIDNLNSTLRHATQAPSINGFALGSHIITRQLSDHAIALTTKHQSNAKIDRGGRHVFAIPWRGFSLIGTSYDEVDNPNGDLSIQASHVDELLEAINDAMPSARLTRDDIISGYTGLYPLNTHNIDSTVYQGSGEYQIIDHHAANGVSGLVTALGAKFTTGRKISALTMKLVNQKLGGLLAVTKTKLVGSDFSSFGNSFSALRQTKIKQYQGEYSAEAIEHFLMLYGSNLDAFLSRIANHPDLQTPICATQPDVLGQVTWAIENEQAQRLDDILYGRTSLGLLGIKEEELKPVAQLMAKQLGWSSSELADELAHSVARLNKTQSAIQGN